MPAGSGPRTIPSAARPRTTRRLSRTFESWGEPVGLGVRAPSLADDERFRAWWARYLRRSASPRAAYALTQMNGPIDTRHVRSAVSAPTLVIHRSGDRALPVEGARYLAERIEGAKLAELPGDDHLPFVGNQDEIPDEVEEFLMGGCGGGRRRTACSRPCSSPTSSARRSRRAEPGDRGWKDLLPRHHAVGRRQLHGR